MIYRFCLEALARTTLVRNDLLEGISLYEGETRERARSVGQSQAGGNGRAVIVRRVAWFVDCFVRAALRRVPSSGNARGCTVGSCRLDTGPHVSTCVSLSMTLPSSDRDMPYIVLDPSSRVSRFCAVCSGRAEGGLGRLFPFSPRAFPPPCSASGRVVDGRGRWLHGARSGASEQLTHRLGSGGGSKRGKAARRDFRSPLVSFQRRLGFFFLTALVNSPARVLVSASIISLCFSVDTASMSHQFTLNFADSLPYAGLLTLRLGLYPLSSRFHAGLVKHCCHEFSRGYNGCSVNACLVRSCHAVPACSPGAHRLLCGPAKVGRRRPHDEQGE